MRSNPLCLLLHSFVKMCSSFEYVQLYSMHIWRCTCQRYIPFHSWPDATSYSLKGSNFILIRDELQVWLKCTKILEGYFVSLFFQPYISNTKYLYQKSGGSKFRRIMLSLPWNVCLVLWHFFLLTLQSSAICK